MCSCLPGYSGDPFRYCSFVPAIRKHGYYFHFLFCHLKLLIIQKIAYLKFNAFITETPESNPCIPSPCGPNSQCRSVNGRASCICLPPNIEGPNGCRPECVVSSECSANRACINQKCVDPCPGVCGQNARCETINHSPICSCPASQTGDPFVRCFSAPSKFFYPQSVFFFFIYLFIYRLKFFIINTILQTKTHF